MPATNLPGWKTKLSVTISSVVTEIENTFDISWDGFAVAERNPTAHSSTAKPKYSGMPDYGTIKAKVYYDPNNTTHKYLRDAVKTPTPLTLDTFTLTYNDTYSTHAKATCTGFVKSFNQSGFEPESGTVAFELEIPVSTATFADGV